MNTQVKDVLSEDDDDLLPIEGLTIAAPEPDEEVDIVIADEEAPANETQAAPVAENPVEAAAPEDDAGDDDADPDLDPETLEMRKHLRPKFKKRLDREIRAKKEAQYNAYQAINYARERDAEVASLKQQNAILQSQYAETIELSVADRLANRVAALKKAREDGEFDAEAAVQGEIDDLRYKLNKVKEIRASMPTPQAPQQGQQPPPQAQAPQQRQQQPQTPPSPKAMAWVNKNKAWLGNEDFSAEQAALLAIDNAVKKAGFDPGTDAYYVELDKRLDAKFPNLRKKPVDTPSPVAAVNGGGAAPNGKKTITVTRADLNTMRTFGLDPNNKEHVRDFVRNRAGFSA